MAGIRRNGRINDLNWSFPRWLGSDRTSGMDAASLSYAYSQEAVSAAVVDQLRRTRGWVLFLSVLLWVGAVFLSLGGLIMIGLGVFSGSVGMYGKNPLNQVAGVGSFVVFGALYVAMAIFYFYPAIKLGKFAARIRDLSAAPSERNLVAALNEQLGFWKYVGIVMILLLVLYVVIIIVGIAVGILGSAAGNLN